MRLNRSCSETPEIHVYTLAAQLRSGGLNPTDSVKYLYILRLTHFKLAGLNMPDQLSSVVKTVDDYVTSICATSTNKSSAVHFSPSGHMNVCLLQKGSTGIEQNWILIFGILTCMKSLAQTLTSGMGKLRPGGHMWPVSAFNPARRTRRNIEPGSFISPAFLTLSQLDGALGIH